MIKGVQSVIIWTEDLGRLMPFYRDVVGLTPAMEGDAFTVFQAESGAQLALGQHSEVKGPSRDPNRVMVDLGVDDCRAEYERLNANGVQFVRPPAQEQNGMWIATLKDPDGNLIQLFQDA
jgi:predicted enzyme related to lactoylglutathione lyase